MMRRSALRRTLTVATSLLCLASLVMAQSQPSPDDESRSRYKARRSTTGSSLPNTAAHGSTYPLDRSWERFTPEEQATVRDLYEDMPAEDEPPFPLTGMGPIIDGLRVAMGHYRIYGQFELYVDVNAQGQATGIEFVRYPDAESAKIIGRLLIDAKYKPARCGGKPCAMQWPFRYNLYQK